MAQDTIRLSLDGDVSLEDFRTAISAFAELVLLLTKQAEPEASVRWVVDELKAGSATIAVRGEPESEDALLVVSEVVGSVDEIGRHAAKHDYTVWAEYPRAIRKEVSAMFGVLNGKIPRARLGDWLIETPVPVDPPEAPIRPKPRQRTSIKGQIVTLDKKRGTYFTLKEAGSGNLIRCWPDATLSSQLAELWSTGMWVLVEGTYNTFTNRPTLTDITDILSLGTGKKGGWREAFGASPRGPGDSTESVADLVRRVRDGG